MRSPALLRHVSVTARLARVPLACAVVLLALLLTLRHFEYSKGWLVHATVEEARAPRSPLALAGLDWEPARYQQARSLAPLRALVSRHCGARAAVATAECLIDLFARRFPHGVPVREFFDARYSPVEEMTEHLGGAPGHCVTRSGLLAAALLASGFPARVVQLMPLVGGGHNVAEVWDGRGWVFIDPTFRLTVDGPPGTASAAATLGATRAPWRVNTSLRAVDGLQTGAGTIQTDLPRLMGGHLVYPDPWLYTRVGHRAAPAPFQARFVVVGPPSFRLGVVQPLLHIGILLVLLALAASTLSALARARRPSVAPSIDLTRPTNLVDARTAAVLVRRRDQDIDPPGSAVA